MRWWSWASTTILLLLASTSLMVDWPLWVHTISLPCSNLTSRRVTLKALSNDPSSWRRTITADNTDSYKGNTNPSLAHLLPQLPSNAIMRLQLSQPYLNPQDRAMPAQSWATLKTTDSTHRRQATRTSMMAIVCTMEIVTPWSRLRWLQDLVPNPRIRSTHKHTKEGQRQATTHGPSQVYGVATSWHRNQCEAPYLTNRTLWTPTLTLMLVLVTMCVYLITCLIRYFHREVSTQWVTCS